MWHTVNNEKRQKSTWRRSRFYESRKHQSDNYCKSGRNDRPIIVRPARADDFSFVSDFMIQALTPFYDGDRRAHAWRASLTRTSRAGCVVCGELAIKVPCKYPDKVASQFPLNPDRVWFQFH